MTDLFSTKSRRRMSVNNPNLSKQRLDRPSDVHKTIVATKQKACSYCSYLNALANKNGNEAPEIRNPILQYSYCEVYLKSASKLTDFNYFEIRTLSSDAIV